MKYLAAIDAKKRITKVHHVNANGMTLCGIPANNYARTMPYMWVLIARHISGELCAACAQPDLLRDAPAPQWQVVRDNDKRDALVARCDSQDRPVTIVGKHYRPTTDTSVPWK